MTREKIIELARAAGLHPYYEQQAEFIVAFYLAARNEALEEAAQVASNTVCGTIHNVTVWGSPVAAAIMELKTK